MSEFLCVDETAMPGQDNSKIGKHHRGYYWVYWAPKIGVVWMEVRKGRDHNGLLHSLQDVQRHLQSDGYVGDYACDHDLEVILHGCWAHGRRKFVQAQQIFPERTTHMLTTIQQLCRSSAGCARRPARPPSASKRVKKRRSPILEELGMASKAPWHASQRVGLSRQLHPGAVEQLFRFVSFGRVDIDHHLVEKSVRPLAPGRKAYRHAGSYKAAQRAAVIYSLLETCEMQGIDPQTWLEYVRECMPTHTTAIGDLLPHRWTKLESAAIPQTQRLPGRASA